MRKIYGNITCLLYLLAGKILLAGKYSGLSVKRMVKKVSSHLKEKVDLIKRINDLSKQLETEKEKSEEYVSRLKYLQADFENFEKRVNREREDIVKMSSERIVTKLLTIQDDLELAVSESQKMKVSERVSKGLSMILGNLHDVFSQEGVVEIDALGKTFDPSKHEAVSFLESNKLKENTVVSELRKGYILNGKVIRPSTTEVTRKPVKRGGEPSSKVEIKQ
jgi:molecular chaperone GrpE